MVKLTILLLGLIIGFGGGVYWATRYPDAASRISAEEERRFLEAQMKITQAIQSKLDQLQGKAGPATVPAAAVNEAQAEARKQQEELQQRLEALK